MPGLCASVVRLCKLRGCWPLHIVPLTWHIAFMWVWSLKLEQTTTNSSVCCDAVGNNSLVALLVDGYHWWGAVEMWQRFSSCNEWKAVQVEMTSCLPYQYMFWLTDNDDSHSSLWYLFIACMIWFMIVALSINHWNCFFFFKKNWMSNN